MIKYILIALLMFSPIANAGFLGYYGVNDTLNFDVKCPDSLGDATAMDSSFVVVRYMGEGANDSTFAAAGAGAGSAWIDSNFIGGVTSYYFIDLVNDVDGGKPNGMYSINVITVDVTGSRWTWENENTFMKVGDATAAGDNILNHFIVEVIPGVDAEQISGSAPTAESLEANYAGGVTTIPENITTLLTYTDGDGSDGIDADIGGSALNNFDPTSDSVIVDVSSANAGFIPELVDSTLDEVNTGATHNVNSSVAKQIRGGYQAQVITSGTAQSGGATYIVLAAAESFVDDILNSNAVLLTGGTGAGQRKIIADYTGATDSVTLHAGDDWEVNPDGTSEYEIVPDSPVEVAHIHDGGISSASIADRAITPVKYSLAAVAALYKHGVWIDEASGNTDSDVGVDGLSFSPVSTFAAARILADSMALQKYYLINGTSLTLAAAHVSWEFIGIGGSNEVNFGGQDVDSSYLENVMIAGVQGGTAIVLLHRCYMDAADSLECVATNSWFSDTISVRVAPNIIFDQCYSAIPGNTTPGLDFNSAGGTIGVNNRHYSGGLGLINMASTHTISYEADGQLVIDASSTSGNVTARGNMTITDNGTTSSITKDAVFSRGEAPLWVWSNADTAHVDSSDQGVWLVNNLSAASGLDSGVVSRINHRVTWGTPQGSGSDSSTQAQRDVTSVNVATIDDDGIKVADFADPYFTMIADSNWLSTLTSGKRTVDSLVLQDSADYSDAYWRALKNFVWNDTLSDVGDLNEAERFLYTLRGFFDGTAPLDSADYSDEFWVVLARSPWRQVDTVHVDSSVIGVWIVNNTGGGTGLDSATTSRIVGRKVWGIAAGSGSDSSTLSLRSTNVEAWNTGSVNNLDDDLAMIFARDISSYFDTSTNNTFGQLAINIGIDGLGSSVPTIQMKLGDYSGAAGADNNVKEAIAAISIGAGSGANTCTLIVYDTDNSITVSDIKVRANNSSGANQGIARTNVNGVAVLNLDDGTYSLVIPMNSGYIQTTNPQPFVVSGATNDTINVTLFQPSAPAGDLCTVYNWIKDGSDNGIAGITVTARIPTSYWPITYSGQGIKAIRSTKTDGNGKWELPIYPSTILLTTDGDSASYWQITASEKLYGDEGYKVTVPDSATFKMVPDSLQ